MDKSLAMLEYATVSSGMSAADVISKTANIQFIKAKTVCPGKFLILFKGELSALKSAIEAAKKRCGDKLIDSFILGNPHPAIFEALEKELILGQIDTLGIIETTTSASTVKAADISAKAAKVQLLEIRLAKSMCGKAYVLFAGSVSSVEESINIVLKQIGEAETILDFTIISAPEKGFIEALCFD